MARLPQVGGDAGNWGDVLNDYLSQSHDADGSLKADIVGSAHLAPNSVTTAAIADATVAEAKLSPGVQAKLNAAPIGITDGSVTTAKLADGAVTDATVATNAAIAQTKIAGLISALAVKADSSTLAAKADDAAVVHRTSDETIAGIKTFSSAPVVPDASFTIAKTSGLQTTLDATLPLSQRAAAFGVASLDGSTKVPLAQIPVQAIADDAILAGTYVAQSSAPEIVRDTIGAALVAGANVTITPNDGTDTITIAATSSGSFPAWQSTTAYAAGASVVNAFGELVMAKSAHTSTSTYDGTKWKRTSSTGASVLDFTQMPDGGLEVIRPTVGSYDSPNASAGLFAVSGGRFIKTSASAGNAYVQVECSDTVRHAWLVIDFGASVADNSGPLILLPGPYKWGSGLDQNRAGVHNGLVPFTTGAVPSNGRVEGSMYNVPGGLSSASVGQAGFNFANRRVRFDVTVDPATGQVRNWIDGQLVNAYIDPAIVGYISRFALFELTGQNVSIVEFGASPKQEEVLSPAGYARVSGFALPASITTTWAEMVYIDVAYGPSGSVEVYWNPYIDCAAGNVQMELGPYGGTAPYSAGPYFQVIAAATTKSRVFFSQTRVGVPGTTERVGLFARTSSGTSSFGSNTAGQGPRWRPISQTLNIRTS